MYVWVETQLQDPTEIWATMSGRNIGDWYEEAMGACADLDYSRQFQCKPPPSLSRSPTSSGSPWPTQTEPRSRTPSRSPSPSCTFTAAWIVHSPHALFKRRGFLFWMGSHSWPPKRELHFSSEFVVFRVNLSIDRPFFDCAWVAQ
jgi:hypothetical protein